MAIELHRDRPAARAPVLDVPTIRCIGLAGVIGMSGISARMAQATEADIAAFAPTVTDGQPDLRALASGLPDGSGVEDRAFTLEPAIGVRELLTDNVYEARSPRLADLVTSILPELLLSGRTPLAQADVSYMPDIQLYARTSQQDQVVQRFNGQVQLTAVPQTLFLSLRGTGDQQSTIGSYGQGGLPYYGEQNRTDVVALQASPYLRHRFGGDGTLQAGYVFNYSSQTGSQGGTPSAPADLLLSQDLGNSVTRANEGYASFTTGENLGRFTDTARLDVTRYDGSGDSVLNGARRSTAIDSFGYGLSRAVALLGSAGYEDIAYSGLPPIRIRDAVWNAGIRLTPNQASSLTAKYGHKDGFDSLTLASSYAVTARLRVFATYSEGLTSGQEEIQDNLDQSSVDQFGNTVSTATGAPTLVSDQLLSLQNDLYRVERFSASAVSTYARDVVSLTVEQENRNEIASASSAPGYSDHGTSIDLSWSHDLTPKLTVTTTLRYSDTRTETVPVSKYKIAGLDLDTGYAISPSLTATFSYFIRNVSADSAGQSSLQNAVLVGLRQSF